MLADLNSIPPEGPNAKAATMEVSSHGLALGRVYGLQFHTAVFTNLTQDHLDFHATMDDYFAAKQLLFTGSGGPPPRYAVINRDDGGGRKRGQTLQSERLLVRPAGQRPRGDGCARGISIPVQWIAASKLSLDKVRFEVQSPLIQAKSTFAIFSRLAVRG